MIRSLVTQGTNRHSRRIASLVILLVGMDFGLTLAAEQKQLSPYQQIPTHSIPRAYPSTKLELSSGQKNQHNQTVLGRAVRIADSSNSANSQPSSTQPTSAAPSKSSFSPEDIFSKLRRAVGVTSKMPEELPYPTPGKSHRPDQHVIPVTKPTGKSNVVVEGRDGMISLMVRDGSLRQVIALIAETQKLNIVFASPTDTHVTASFDRVPWQRVLDSLMSASGHIWTNEGNIIFISSIESADFMPPGAGGRHAQVFEIDFISAVDADQAVQGMLSPAGKSWVMETSPLDNRRTREAVTVVDYPAFLQRIDGYICQIDQPPRQVLIEAHILEVELKDDHRHGVNFENLATFRGNEIKLSTVGFANAAASPGAFIGVTGTALTGLIELLQSTTDAKTLASPKILAVSGQESRIQIGEQLGFRVTTTTQTSTLETIEFLDVGVVLRVTPRITRDGRVLMRIKPEVSTGQVSVETGLPSEATTEVETDVLLSDGEGMVIGGLIQEQDDNIQSKIPLLGDIPYLGVLFQRRQVVKSRSEIIVTLLPHIQPYTPVVAHRNQYEFMRTTDPLTAKAICSYPRPYEPRLPDAMTNNRHRVCTLPGRYSPGDSCPTDSDLTPLPPMEGERQMSIYQP